MATEFLRLYRELEKIDPHAAPSDIRYKSERKVVMKALGYDIQGISKWTDPPKHHGKLARRTQHEKRQDALHSSYGDEAKKKVKLQKVLAEANRLNIAATELSGMLFEKKEVPKKIWKKFLPSEAELAAQAPIELPPVIKAKVAVRERVVPRQSVTLPKSFTRNRWSNEERQRLNELYLEIRKPPTNNANMWRVYYETVAARFHTIYPRRSLEEIMEKMEQMIVMRQMKEVGEPQFWKETQSRAHET